MKKRVLLFVLLLMTLSIQCVFAQAVKLNEDTLEMPIDTTQMAKQEVKIILKKGSSKIDSLINYAYHFIGNRYKRGGVTTKGFDCSGYTMIVFQKYGIKLPHTSAGQGLVGVEVTRNNIKKGDLILFRGRSRRSKRIGHVGIVISEKGEPVRFIHSSTSEGVRIDRLEFDYYKKRYLQTVRMPELYK
jgi:cell wall-associated NlpC family hydrolase